MTLRTASNEGSGNDAEEGSSTSSINPPSDARMRWRRKLCLTERSQQRQSGPTTKAWRRLPARQRHDACETPSEHLREAVPKLERNACRRGNVGRMARHRPGTCKEHCQSCMEKGWRVRVAPPGVCGLHRQKEIHAGVDSIVSKNLADNGIATPRDMRARPLGDAQMAASGRVRGGTARKRRLDECG